MSAELRDAVPHRETQIGFQRAFLWLGIGLILAVAVAAMSLGFTLWEIHVADQTVTELRSENAALKTQVDATNRQVECRSRVSSWAAGLESTRNSLGWEILIDRAIAGPNPDVLRPKVQELNDLNQRVALSSDIRSRSTGLCTENPDYRPPT